MSIREIWLAKADLYSLQGTSELMNLNDELGLSKTSESFSQIFCFLFFFYISPEKSPIAFGS
jgi:hypothetical protein